MAENNIKSGNTRSERLVLTVALLTSAAIIGVISGCGSLDGDISTNQLPLVEFTNIPADRDTFSFAPVIHWKGRDPDGFVEEYLYADVIDSTALLNPQYYIPFTPQNAWIRTQATSDTVYLLTETGRITEHVFYLKCIDDRETESAVIFRSFYRSNRPPRVPQIKWFADADDSFGERIAITDTSYSLNAVTESWPGIGFNWRSSDPDDRELYRIPLEFKYYLEKVPHDTVWEWVSQNWTTRQDLVLARLETGHYTLTVWARDDGYEISERPATAIFDVYKPTFEQSILLFNTTRENFGQPGRGNVLPGTQIGELYRELSSRYPDREYFHYAAGDTILPFKGYLGRFKLVVWFSENKDRVNAPFESELRDYVRAGGRLWVLGSYVRSWTTNTTIALAESSYPAQPGQFAFPGTKAEFTDAIAGVTGMPGLVIDTAKTGALYRVFWGGYSLYPCLPGVDIITTGSGAETVYTFGSYTDTASGDVVNEQAFVKVNVDAIYYPPTSVDCLIEIDRKRVLRVSRIENITRGVRGEVQSLTNNVGTNFATVVRISYQYGEPWSIDDSVVADYEFQPFSTFHRKPIAIRYEKIVSKPGGTFEVRYRVAVFTFPLYFLDNTVLPGHAKGSVTEMFNEMLDWFFYPFAH